MSSAEGKGYARGRAFIQVNVERVTFDEYRKLGNVDAQKHYKLEKSQKQYLLGWWHAGEQFLTLFKKDNAEPYGVEKKIQEIRRQISHSSTSLDDLRVWREEDTQLHSHLQEAYDLLQSALVSLNNAKDALKQSEKGEQS